MALILKKHVLNSDQRRRNFFNEYVLREKIGEPGLTGYVRECVKMKDGTHHAVKIINKSKIYSKKMFIISRPARKKQKRAIKQMKREVTIMKSLDRHPNIVRFDDVFEDEKFLYIVMECCLGGELYQRIIDKKRYPEKEAVSILRQLISSIEYLHSNRIAHCDIKPDNILFESNEQNSNVKLCDFGLSKRREFREYFENFCGTPYYIAPEVIRERYTESCDMWSVGVVMFILLFGFPPFHADNSVKNEKKRTKNILKKISRGFSPITAKDYGPWFPSSINCSDMAKDLISKLLNYDFVERITATEALCHPWFNARRENILYPHVDVQILESLKLFQKCPSNFRNVVLSILNESQTADQKLRLMKEFKKLESNNTRIIRVKKLISVFQNVDSCVSGRTVIKILEELNSGKTGFKKKLTFEKMCNSFLNYKLIFNEERVWKAFQALDLNKDGKITVSDLSESLKNIKIDKNIGSNVNVAKIIAEVDSGNKGCVDYKDFLR